MQTLHQLSCRWQRRMWYFDRVYFRNVKRKNFEMCPYMAKHIWYYIILKYACALEFTTRAHTIPSILIKRLILILQFIFIFQFVTYSPLSYDKYKYPDWGQVIGWLLTLSSLSLIPAVMIYKLTKTTGTMKDVNISGVVYISSFKRSVRSFVMITNSIGWLIEYIYFNILSLSTGL